jgi:hypothetical protein
MSTIPRVTLVPFSRTTMYAPLVALGFYVREHDLLRPVISRLQFAQPTHVVCPQSVLLDLWVSILAGCRSVSHINTRLRPDHVLARAWGRPCFSEQSTVARVLDACQVEQVDQLRAGTTAVYRWIGQACDHQWGASPLMIDVDLTGLPAGRTAQGCTKGYFSGKKGGAVVSCAESPPPSTTRASPHCCIRATHSVKPSCTMRCML